jgi:hypothetical protein
MAARFPALSDNNINTALYGLASLLGCTHCMKDYGAGFFRSLNEC